MATFKLTDAVLLDRRIARARQIMVEYMVPDQEYSTAELLALLVEHGLDLGNPSYVEVGQALIAAGIIEST